MTGRVGTRPRGMPDEGKNVITCRWFDAGVHVIAWDEDRSGLSGQLFLMQPLAEFAGLMAHVQKEANVVRGIHENCV